MRNKININNINLLKWRQQIGYVSQDPSLFDDTILNNLTLMKNYDEKKMQKIIIRKGNAKCSHSILDLTLTIALSKCRGHLS